MRNSSKKKSASQYIKSPFNFAFFYIEFLTSYFCIPVPYNEKDIFFGC